VAAGIAILGRLHMVNTYLILLFVLLMETGIALNAPAFSSLLTDVVSEKELASASILTGLQFDLSAIVGSALAGAVGSRPNERHRHHVFLRERPLWAGSSTEQPHRCGASPQY
jgi:Transmembrane secretion effector